MMEYTHYNRIKTASKRAHNNTCISSAERKLTQPKVKSVLAEKSKAGTWLSEQMGRNFGTVSQWMPNKVQPSVDQLYETARYLDVDIKKEIKF